ncbi:uncharacterized protein LOC111480698 [Cucurbita maxima]|uniref:Uncharacterized protein LOC111480698 n=1 Tax=Cucurbita maxima TaxID=3661 RepID=A0A6J1J2M8_CUCMA|nr:uncharacterized protein LOC111480698 [Cucurbita maxima]
MTGAKSAFSELDFGIRGTVKFCDGSVIEIEGHDTILFVGKHHKLTGVYIIPRLKANIVRLGQLDKAGCHISIKRGILRIRDDRRQLLTQVWCTANHLYIQELEIEQSVNLSARYRRMEDLLGKGEPPGLVRRMEDLLGRGEPRGLARRMEDLLERGKPRGLARRMEDLLGRGEPCGRAQRMEDLLGRGEPPGLARRMEDLLGRGEPCGRARRMEDLLGRGEPCGRARRMEDLLGRGEPPGLARRMEDLLGRGEPPRHCSALARRRGGRTRRGV